MEEKDIPTPAEEEEVREPDEAVPAVNEDPGDGSPDEAADDEEPAVTDPPSSSDEESGDTEPAGDIQPAEATDGEESADADPTPANEEVTGTEEPAEATGDEEPAEASPVEAAGDEEPSEDEESAAPPPGDADIDSGELSLEVKPSEPAVEAARLLAIIEAAVYITDDPLTARQIADALDQPVADVQAALDALVAKYEQAEHGIAIREVAEGYKMATKAEHHEAIRSFVKKLQKPLKLSMAALETLAVVAYKQPITAPEIMEIRGVQGAGVLKTLLDRKLITTAGRKNVIGKPILYKTTKEFLVQFGLKNLKELPTLKEFEELARIALSDAEEPEGPASPSEAPLFEANDGAAAETESATEGESQAEPGDAEEAAGEPETGSEPEAAADMDDSDEESANEEPADADDSDEELADEEPADVDDSDEEPADEEPAEVASEDEPEPKGPQSEAGDPADDSETERHASPKE